MKVLRLDEAETKIILGGPIKVMFNRETAGSRYSTFSVGYFNPGEGLKPHLHPESEEVYFIVEGSGTVYLGAEQKPIEVGAKTGIYIPPRTIHSVKNTGSEKLVIAFFVAPGKEKSELVG
ncbi:MAG: cupin domain-containing protein [Candidatus Bathyarchaeia archaeon]